MIAEININDLDKVKSELEEFVWNFKHGDNILYNFEVLNALYESRSKKISNNSNIFNKPITIMIVSLIEAILIDFLTRIDQATSHLPAGISLETLEKIKAEIEKQKKPETIEDDFGDERIYLRRKMYHFNEIIKIFERYELFGKKEDKVYELLNQFGKMRNRVHIENYYQNFEDREYKVFTSARLEILESVISALWFKMVNDYKRPWK